MQIIVKEPSFAAVKSCVVKHGKQDRYVEYNGVFNGDDIQINFSSFHDDGSEPKLGLISVCSSRTQTSISSSLQPDIHHLLREEFTKFVIFVYILGLKLIR